MNDIDLGAIIQQAFTLANAYLPKKIQEEVTVYILYGIRGTGIMLGNEIAIDICDEYVSIDGFLDINNLIAILAHEFHTSESMKTYPIAYNMWGRKTKV